MGTCPCYQIKDQQQVQANGAVDLRELVMDSKIPVCSNHSKLHSSSDCNALDEYLITMEVDTSILTESLSMSTRM